MSAAGEVPGGSVPAAVAVAAVVTVVDGARRALPVEAVREVMTLANLTPVPTAPPPVCGVSQLRGQVLPVVDVGLLLDGEMAPARPPRVPRIGDALVVVELDGARAALVVDSVEGVIELKAQQDARGAAPLDLRAALDALRRRAESSDALPGDGDGDGGGA